VKIAAEKSMKLQQEEERQIAHELSLHVRAIKVARKDRELSHYDIVKSIRTSQEKKIMDLREEFERKSDELRQAFARKMSVVRKKFADLRKTEVTSLEDRKNAQIQQLMDKHKKSFEEIKTYFQDLSSQNIDQIIQLKNALTDKKQRDQQVMKQRTACQLEYARLAAPLRECVQQADALQKTLDDYQLDKQSLDVTKSKLIDQEEKMKTLGWKQEILEQRLSALLQERDGIQKKLESTIYSVQQKTGFRNLLLEKKFDAMAHDLEKTQAALAELMRVVQSSSLQPDVVGQLEHSLQEVLLAKNKLILSLQQELQTLRHKYAVAIDTYEGKLKEYEIPLEELGFTPLRRI